MPASRPLSRILIYNFERWKELVAGRSFAKRSLAALERAGVESAHKGAHLLRHSLATHMLAKGASLGEIGEILRHRSTDTTAIYAKVELEALRPLAMRWPGGME